MKFLIVFAAVVAVTLAAVPNQRQFPVPSQRQFPVSNEKQVVVVKETPSNNIGLENYLYSYELSDGQKRQESAEVVARSAEDVVLRVTGSFSFVGQDGQTYTVKYVADENGFQPEGAHLPVAPVV